MTTVRRKIKNVVNNYTFAENKIRDATSSHSTGPSQKQLEEIAELSFHAVAVVEILGVLWKRLFEKNKMHINKSLIVLNYLIKFGHKKVVNESLVRIESIKSLQNFELQEDGRGIIQSIRELATSLVSLLNDPDRLRNEQAKMAVRKKNALKDVKIIQKIDAPNFSIYDHTSPIKYMTIERKTQGFQKTSNNLNLSLESNYLYNNNFCISNPKRGYESVSEVDGSDGIVNNFNNNYTDEEDSQLKLALELSRQEQFNEMHRKAEEESHLSKILNESRIINDHLKPQVETSMLDDPMIPLRVDSPNYGTINYNGYNESQCDYNKNYVGIESYYGEKKDASKKEDSKSFEKIFKSFESIRKSIRRPKSNTKPSKGKCELTPPLTKQITAATVSENAVSFINPTKEELNARKFTDSVDLDTPKVRKKTLLEIAMSKPLATKVNDDEKDTFFRDNLINNNDTEAIWDQIVNNNVNCTLNDIKKDIANNNIQTDFIELISTNFNNEESTATAGAHVFKNSNINKGNNINNNDSKTNEKYNVWFAEHFWQNLKQEIHSEQSSNETFDENTTSCNSFINDNINEQSAHDNSNNNVNYLPMSFNGDNLYKNVVLSPTNPFL